MSRDVPDPTEVDIVSAWRTARELVYRATPGELSSQPSQAALIAISILAAGSMVARSLNQIEYRLRVISWDE